ncbi:MAG: LysR family transcriptional regulator [Streptosporangiales bacterium]|nr:LysR family transcriptional regulator [Streptosporangiales bacterium]
MAYMIDMRRLRVLRAVAYHGTVTAAAKALHFTPSAASQQIRQLGRELGVTLLEPNGRRVRLTPAARSLLAHADAIEAQWERAEVDLRSADDQPAGLLRVAGFPVAVSTLLAPMTTALRARYPRLTVEIRETEPKDSFDLLFEGAVDLAIVEATTNNPPPSDVRFDQRPLVDDTFDLVVPATHRLAGRDTVDLAETADECWIAPIPQSTCHGHVFSACSAAGFTPNVVHRALEWNAIAHLVAYGLGFALVPRLAYLAPHLPIVRVPLGDGAPRRKLLTCTRGGGHQHPAAAAALDELHRLAPAVAADASPGGIDRSEVRVSKDHEHSEQSHSATRAGHRRQQRNRARGR